MELQDLYDLIESHLGNEICSPKNGKMKRIKLPIPPEFGGGVVTGNGYLETVRNLIERIRPVILKEEDESTPLFRESWEEWIRIKAGQSRSPSTVESYKGIAKVHLLPFFGEKRMGKITPDDIQTYFNSVMHLSRSVSEQSRAILQGIFNRAVRQGEIERNIMLYSYDRSKKVGEKVVLQDEDLLQVIEQLDKLHETGDKRDYLYFCFLCFTALRRGEILGLRWGDLDFEQNEIHVRNNVIFPNGKNDPIIGKPKDGSSGVVHMNSELRRRLEGFKRESKESQSTYVIPYSDKEPTKPMTRSMFTKMWNRCKNTIDLKGATSHSFRSSYATMMNAHCQHIDPKALQGALRHKTPDLAIRVYTKENGDKTRLAEEEYDSWLSGHIASGTPS